MHHPPKLFTLNGRTLLLTHVFLFMTAVSLTGCIPGLLGSSQTAPPPAPVPVAEQDPRLNKIDEEIAKTEKDIDWARDTMRGYAYEMVTMGNHPGGGKMGAGLDEGGYLSPQEAFVMASQNFDAAAAYLKDQETKLKDLKNTKSSLLGAKNACFPTGTLVMMKDGGFRPIEEIRTGDAVLTLDVAGDVYVPRPVKSVFSSPNTHYYLINGQLKATSGERFMTDKGWRYVDAVRPGDSIRSRDRWIVVETKDLFKTDVTVYNLEVEDSHNFFVAVDPADPWLVHNTGGGGHGGGAGSMQDRK